MLWLKLDMYMELAQRRWAVPKDGILQRNKALRAATLVRGQALLPSPHVEWGNADSQSILSIQDSLPLFLD